MGTELVPFYGTHLKQLKVQCPLNRKPELKSMAHGVHPRIVQCLVPTQRGTKTQYPMTQLRIQMLVPWYDYG